MQKGLDKSGVMMPKFDGVGASFGAEPVETEEERIARELAEFEDIFTDLQAQIRGAVGRLMLGDMMESLWENEAQIADLQSRVRGCFARQIFSYRLDMHQANTKLQAACRGFLARRKSKYQNIEMQSIEPQLLAFQSLVRAKKARQEMKHVHNSAVRHERSIAKLQAAIRGAFLRGEYLDQQEETQAAEEDVTYLQAAIRGVLTRRRLDYSYEELRHAADPQLCMLQAGIRGALARQAMAKQQASLRHIETPMQALQALARGYVSRQSVHAQRAQMHEQRNEQALCMLQASIKGALARKALQAQTTELAEASQPVEKLQALARGLSLRKKMDGLQSQLRSFDPLWLSLQSLSRGRAVREAITNDRHKLEDFVSLWTSLQSHARGDLLRQSVADTQAELEAHTSSIIQLQSAIRSALQRNLVDELLSSLEENQDSIIALQSHVRGFLCRNDLHNDMEVLGSMTEQLVELQSFSRGAILRVNLDDLLVALEETAPEIEELQGLARGMLTRMSIGTDLMELEAEESMITEFQSNIRGFCVRRKFAEKERFYRENMEKVVKVQSIFRGKIQGEAYRSLTSGKNPPVGTVKGFVHLLNDSDFDFDEEIEFERLRKTVVQQIRQNEVADEHINELDTKIALLLQNKITLDEIVKRQKHFGGHVGAMIANADKDPFDLKALNKDSRRRLEQYQELFFLLQTQPQYIARMFIRLQQQGLPDKDAEAIKHAIMRLFGYAQKRREEYHLVKLIVRSVKEEIAVSPDVAAYERHGNFLWCKVFSIYKNAPKDRQFIGEVLGEFIKHWVLNPQLDLESNPLRIYRSLINNEELRTGRRSRRNPDISEQQAVQDPETKAVFVRNLQDLRDIADHFIASLEDRLHRMPFGVRYIARQMYESLLERFPEEDKGLLLKTTGKWIWKYYFRPAILEPEKHGAIDHGMTQEQKRNLSIIARVIGHLASAMEFGGETRYLNPLNGWLAMRAQHLASIWARGDTVIQVQDAETYFNIDEFNDLYAKQKPTLYIKLSDISFINRLIRDNVNYICTDPNDVLKDVVREMQNEKHEAELMRYSSTEVHLTLTPKLINAEDPDSDNRTLMMETKRCVLYIIRVQTAPNLLEIMLKQPTFEDEKRWRKLVRDELSVNSSRRGAYADSGTALADISKLSYQELKATALEHILFLEQRGKVTRANNYQDILNAIAIDIRTKHRRRLQRQKELESARMTLTRLNDQASYLRSQMKIYDTYIEQAMMTLHNKKGKKRFLMPFTKQWDHQRELQKLGREVKFGSYKYSARNLANRGVLVYWKGFSERDWDRVDLTISSNEVGVFMLDGTTGNMVVPKASAQLPLDDLLQAQYNNNQFMDLFDGQLRVNVNLFLHLIMKKFYN
ncbi:hypothetical protein KEM55_006034 [Ascosphaera atra]|nr:hypothetical protein KEM55_006034 [Ascosphaera atra]